MFIFKKLPSYYKNKKKILKSKLILYKISKNFYKLKIPQIKNGKQWLDIAIDVGKNFPGFRGE
jgi:hypothetical protein